VGNSNCLRHCRCPDCGQTQSFKVVATSVFTMFDDGVDGYGHVEYDERSPVTCSACDWSGCWAELDERRAALPATLVTGLVINAPEFFHDKDFVQWLNSDEPIMTWHRGKQSPSEWSDTVVLVDPHLNGEGADSSMPPHIWRQIVEACRKAGLGGQREHIPVRLTNLSEC